ncbi:MAG: hypothetical protein ACRDL6_07760 [Solirubrobacterales bacterium]
MIASLAATVPDPGSQDFPAFSAIVSGALGTGFALARGLAREDVQWYGFLGTFLGAVGGLLLYFALLVTDLY